MRAASVSLVLLLSMPLLAEQRPLPDLATFIAASRAKLELDEARQSGYVYLETRRERKLDASGRAVRETVNVYESYPGLPGQPRWERQIRKDGRAVPSDQLARRDRERQQKVMAWVRERERHPDLAREAEARERAERRRKQVAIVADAERIYEFQILGRETVGGHDTIVLRFSPRPGVAPHTREGRMMAHVAGKAWVSESEHEVVRLEGEALDTISVGLGVVARVHEGSRAAFERRKVNGEAWLPARVSYTASARVMLVKMMRLGGVSEYSNYRKFSVDTDAVVKSPG
jgi:hypothetical protein